MWCHQKCGKISKGGGQFIEFQKRKYLFNSKSRDHSTSETKPFTAVANSSQLVTSAIKRSISMNFYFKLILKDILKASYINLQAIIADVNRFWWNFCFINNQDFDGCWKKPNFASSNTSLCYKSLNSIMHPALDKLLT